MDYCDGNGQDICRLASLLRESGDKVLNGNSKLRLTPALLMKLNAAFSSVSIVGFNNDFQVTSAHASQPPSTSQLHFLHDFVQKTIGLTIAGTSCCSRNINTEGSIDLSRFRSLRHLELKSCIAMSSMDPTHILKGSSILQSQLETLVLMHIVSDCDLLWSILSSGAVDIGPGNMWPRLTQLVVSYCGLRSLGGGLYLANNLQWLDASHNMLTDCEGVGSCLCALPKLRYLNLSFNRLKGIPRISHESLNTVAAQLQFLLLSHNYIDNLNGVECLTGLVELNLTGNQIRDHSQLHSLRTLYRMQHLKLEGNPIFFHKNHRLRTAPFLSPRAVFFKHRYRRDSVKLSPFLLDGVKLTVAEMIEVKNGPISSSFSFKSDTSSSLISPSSSTNVKSILQDKGKPSRRNRKVRHVVIADLDDGETEVSNAMNTSCGSLESSGEHMRRKQEIESVKKRFGQENWLRAKARPAVEELLGLPATQALGNPAGNSLAVCQPLSSSTPLTFPGTPVATPFTSHLDVETMENLVFDIQSVSISKNASEVPEVVKESGFATFSSQSTQYTTANESDSVLQVTADTLNASETSLPPLLSQGENTSEETYVNEENSYSNCEEYDGDVDDCADVGDYSTFLVQEVDASNNVIRDSFLVISSRYIKELNPSTGQRRQRWVLDTLQSCVITSVNPCCVHLCFNTVVQSKKERIYQMDVGEAQQQFLPMLQKILEARPLSAMNFAAFRCMNCSGEFSADLNSRKGSRKCPTCGSVLVFELDETPLPSVGTGMPQRSQSQDTQGTAPQDISELNSSLVHSSSCSSIGSAVSLEFPSNAVEPNTSTNTNLRRCESDIDIISNPSQSSIEVLDDMNRSSGTPGRKRSSEERQVVAVPSLHSVPECVPSLAPLPAGLTESSSSGSLTDSVCTAYENNSVAPVGGTSHKILHGLASTALKEETSRENSPHCEEQSQTSQDSLQPTSLSNVLDGLLQTISLKMSPKEYSEEKLKKKNLTAENFIQYDYIDFSSVDHRLKLHLCLSVLDTDEREVIQLLLRAEVVVCSSGTRYPGILILTSKKVYVIKITGPEEGDQVDRWVSRGIAWPRKSIQNITALPWATGILLSLQGSFNVDLWLILRDQQYLHNFFSFLNKIPQESTWRIESVPSEKHSSKVNQVLVCLAQDSFMPASSPTLIFVGLICGSSIEQDEDKRCCEGGMLMVTSSGLLLCNDEFEWLLPPENSTNDCNGNPIGKQLISNLIEVESSGLELLLHFLDESVGREEVWKLALQSDSVRAQIIQALRCPWEELFSVPLQVNNL